MARVTSIKLAVLVGWITLGQSASAQTIDPVLARASEIGFFSEIEGLKMAGELNRAEALLIETFLTRPGAPIDVRIAWLDMLAELQLEAGKPGDAGDSYVNQAQLVGRLAGPDSPTIAPLYRAAGDAYSLAGGFTKATRAYETALDLDRKYLACDSEALGQLYEVLAQVHEAMGATDAANAAALLAKDTASRCATFDQTRGLGDLISQPDESGDFTLVEIAYATDRATTGTAQPEDFFGAERSELTYGRAVVSIPLSHKPGAIETSSLFRLNWNTNSSQHVVLMGIEPLGHQDMFRFIGSRLENSNDGIFVFIHGYNSSFSDGAKRTGQMAYDMNFTGLPIFYSWPSHAKPGAYIADSAAVEYSARHLLGFLKEIADRTDGQPIHLVAHSMGNRALMYALELLGIQHEGSPIFSQIIFAAPDVDAAVFAQQISVVAPLADRLTLYTSDADLALITSRQLHGGNPRAGQGGVDVLVTEAVETVDMSKVGSDVLRHSYFADESSALADILWLFRRNAPPDDRCGMQKQIKPEGAYWIFFADQCDGGVILSALTLVNDFGAGALAEIDRRFQELVDESTIAELNLVRAVLADILKL